MVKYILRLVSELKKIIFNQKISVKITFLYFCLLIITLSLSSMIYTKIFSSITLQKVNQAAMQTLYLIDTNIDSLFENINNYSKMILSNEVIRDALNNKTNYYDINTAGKVEKVLRGFEEAMPQISSIYIYDNYGRRYYVEKLALKRDRFKSIQEVSWFDTLLDYAGGYLLKYNSGNLFEPVDNENYVSHVRIINDIQTMEIIGVLVINITDDAIKKSFEKIIDRYDTDIAVFDEDNQPIVSFKKRSVSDLVNLREVFDYPPKLSASKADMQKYLLSGHVMEKYNWKIVSAMKFDELSQDTGVFRIVTLIIIVFTGIILFIGSLTISRMIAVPAIKLLKSMKKIEKGEFVKIEAIKRNDEMGKLVHGFNIMIEEIQSLIRRIIKNQKDIRHAELQALQAQIKPHFLYNTFDVISSLALDGENRKIYAVIKSLGNYYRTSLSKGSEVITLKQEVDIVKNYLIIQQVRYGEIFIADFNIDERAEDFKVLKLILQPLVENALYHGIKPMGYGGIIRISTQYNGDKVVVHVEDNGVGMSGNDIERILLDSSEERKSFGLKTTLERIGIFYGISNFYKIESKKGIGTTITIEIPVTGDEMYEQ